MRMTVMFPRSRLSVGALACLAALPIGAAWGQKWREVQSEHFRVVTDGSESDGRDVAREFEQMRSVLAARLNDPALETGAPLTVVAVSESGLRQLAPMFWEQRKQVAGEFFKGWERQFAMVRLDIFGDLKQAVVFHEYTHSVLHANLHWLPVWLDEGMAEFYGYTRFLGDKTYVGAPSVRYGHLRHAQLIPVTEMLEKTSPRYGKDEEREDLFYAEAWAMVHYMTFAPEMGLGAKLNQFTAALQKGRPQLEAFQEIFGDPKAFEKKLDRYLSGFTMDAAVLPTAKPPDAKSFPVRVLTAAEVDYEIGSLDVGAHDPATGKTRLEAAEAADPALAGPHEELGFLAWRRGKDEEAKAEWQKALAADPHRYRSAFALLMCGTPLRDQTPEQLEKTKSALEALTSTAPKFAPVLVELALTEWRLGQVKQAYQSASAAENLEPWRAGYHLLVAHILLQGHQPKLAAEYARTVAERWRGPDHDEAVDLWNRAPAEARGDGPALQWAMPEGTAVARGTILNSGCSKSGLTVSLQPAAPDAGALTLTTAETYMSGFSDTLWVGEDHYTPCFHLSGLPAVIAYKASGDHKGTLMDLEVRDSLPDAPSTVGLQTTGAAGASSETHP